jgi:hypothetical protein
MGNCYFLYNKNLNFHKLLSLHSLELSYKNKFGSSTFVSFIYVKKGNLCRTLIPPL